MALKDNELFSSVAGRGAEIRLFPREEGGLKVGTIAQQSGAPTLLKGLALAYDRDVNLWTVYTQPSDQAIYTITDQAGATDGGTFTLMIDGLDSVHAWNATPAAMEAELLLLLADAGKDYTVAVTNTEANIGVSGAVATLTFSENADAPSVDLDGTGLTDGGVVEPGNLVLAASDAGTQMNGEDQIRGFLYTMEGVVTSASEEVQATIMIDGEVHRDDVNTAALRALMGGSPSEAEVDTALRSQELRKLGLNIRGLTQVS